MKTITCLINDRYPGTPNPLIYTVRVRDPNNEKAILRAVTRERVRESGIPARELELELIIAFDGNPVIAADWRTW